MGGSRALCCCGLQLATIYWHGSIGGSIGMASVCIRNCSGPTVDPGNQWMTRHLQMAWRWRAIHGSTEGRPVIPRHPHLFRSNWVIEYWRHHNRSMFEVCNHLRRISSFSTLCDISDIRCVVNENMQVIAVFHPFFTATRRVTVASKMRDREVYIRIKLHISYKDKSVLRAIFIYFIGAKNGGRI